MRILHVIPGLTVERGGPSAVLHALARHQTALGHQVAVLTTEQGQRAGETPLTLGDAAAVETVPVVGPDFVAYAPDFRDAVRRHLPQADVVHIHSLFTYPVHVALREALAAGVAVVHRPCGHLHRYSLARSKWRKRCYLTLWGDLVRRACTAWHYTSAAEAAESWPGLTGRGFVLPNGIEPAEHGMDRTAARQTVNRLLPGLGEAPYVLFLGRLHPKKRLDLLLAAFVRGVPPRYHLVVAGPDEARLWPALAQRHVQSSAAGRVWRLDLVRGEAKQALLSAAALFALPSEHENFGVAALEALASGTPVLLSPHVDLADAVVAARLGWTVPLDVDAWSRQLADRLTSPERLAAIAERAPAWVCEHYAWDRLVPELIERYRWTQAGCPGAAPPEPRSLPAPTCS